MSYSRVKFFQDECIILSLVVEHVSVIDLSVLKGTFVLIFIIAEREFIVFSLIDDSCSDAANSDPPPLVVP